MKAVAMALTWDGARWPTKNLPAKARAFLAEKTPITAKAVAKLFSSNQVKEIRICWMPILKGGTNVLSEPFFTLTGKRVPFKTVRTIRFDDILGVVYRRLS